MDENPLLDLLLIHSWSYWSNIRTPGTTPITGFSTTVEVPVVGVLIEGVSIIGVPMPALGTTEGVTVEVPLVEVPLVGVPIEGITGGGQVISRP